jgi:hypothetical protein
MRQNIWDLVCVREHTTGFGRIRRDASGRKGAAVVVTGLTLAISLVAGCQNEIDVPPPPDGLVGPIQASPVRGTPGSDNGSATTPAGSTNNDTGTLPNAPNTDAGHVGFNGGPAIGVPDSGAAFNGGPVNTGTEDAGLTGNGF